MCMVTRGHFIIIKIFPAGRQPGGKGKGTGRAAPLSPSSGAIYDRKPLSLSIPSRMCIVSTGDGCGHSQDTKRRVLRKREIMRAMGRPGNNSMWKIISGAWHSLAMTLLRPHLTSVHFPLTTEHSLRPNFLHWWNACFLKQTGSYSPRCWWEA